MKAVSLLQSLLRREAMLRCSFEDFFAHPFFNGYTFTSHISLPSIIETTEDIPRKSLNADYSPNNIVPVVVDIPKEVKEHNVAAIHGDMHPPNASINVDGMKRSVVGGDVMPSSSAPKSLEGSEDYIIVNQGNNTSGEGNVNTITTANDTGK